MKFLYLLAIPVSLVGGYILSLPGKMAENAFVGWLTDIVSKTAFDKFGIRIPGLESVVSKAWFLLPYLAVGSLFYLYHSLYIPAVLRANSLIVEKRPWSIAKTIYAVVSIVSLASFAAAMVGVAYRYHPPASASLKYSELSWAFRNSGGKT